MRDLKQIAKHVFEVEAAAIKRLSQFLDVNFEAAVQALNACQGRIIICGIGKSGLIGKKIAATLSSTGSPSFFLHPSEAIHGDLGMLTANDCFLSISNSGETDEILQVLPYVKELNLPHITLVGQKNSTLATHADWVLYTGVQTEASPVAAVPMASTTTTLAMGDALAAALIAVKDFDEAAFAWRHPGGSLGKKLVTKVADKMERDALPLVLEAAMVKEVIVVMSSGRFGMVVVVNAQQQIQGVITDGDLRRALNKYPSQAFFELKASNLMTANPKSIAPQQALWEAEQIMTQHQITALLVSAEQTLLGIISKQELT